MFFSFTQNFDTSAEHYPTKPCPVLIITVDDYRSHRIFGNVSQPLQP